MVNRWTLLTCCTDYFPKSPQTDSPLHLQVSEWFLFYKDLIFTKIVFRKIFPKRLICYIWNGYLFGVDYFIFVYSVFLKNQSPFHGQLIRWWCLSWICTICYRLCRDSWFGTHNFAANILSAGVDVINKRSPLFCQG